MTELRRSDRAMLAGDLGPGEDFKRLRTGRRPRVSVEGSVTVEGWTGPLTRAGGRLPGTALSL